jgi:lactoylglutathione lyase
MRSKAHMGVVLYPLGKDSRSNEFTFAHNNINVFDLEKSLGFYQKALNLVETRRWENPDFTLVYLGDGQSQHQLELTWLKDRTEPYDLGDNEIHLAFHAQDYDAAHPCTAK